MRMLSPQVFASGQITAQDMKSLADMDFSHVVNHRPDHEEPGQPEALALARAAEAAGLVMISAPVRGLPQAEAVAATRKVLDSLGPDDKALFFCRSGMRSAAAWAMAERLAGADPDALRESAGAAGYDLGGVPL